MAFSSLAIPGLSNIDWNQSLTQRTQWMGQNNVTLLDISPNTSPASVTLTYSSGTTVTGSASSLLPVYLQPLPTLTHPET
jgi:hypothetical protein